ncbi:MAG: hypothetical protein WC575_03170 [Patescibacteria group bacterium]
MGNPETSFLMARHTKKTTKPEEGSNISGEFYQGITEEGEKLVREKTREHLLNIIESSEPGSVVMFLGASDLPRTKSTSQVSANEVKSLLADQTDQYLVYEQKDIESMVDKETQCTREVLSKTVADNPDKKIVLSYPLFLKEFSMLVPEKGPRANEPDWKSAGVAEKKSEYLLELLKRNNDDEDDSLFDWVKNKGEIITEDGKILKGPNPEKVAQDYIQGMRRLENFAKELFPGRPLTIEVSTHSWDIDAFIAYATHQGKLDSQTLEEIEVGTGGEKKFISEFEFPVIKIGGEKQTLNYRGKEWELNSPEFMEEQKQE